MALSGPHRILASSLTGVRLVPLQDRGLVVPVPHNKWRKQCHLFITRDDAVVRACSEELPVECQCGFWLRTVRRLRRESTSMSEPIRASVRPTNITVVSEDETPVDASGLSPVPCPVGWVGFVGAVGFVGSVGLVRWE